VTFPQSKFKKSNCASAPSRQCVALLLSRRFDSEDSQLIVAGDEDFAVGD
jgi:hypothetical protein